MVNTSLNEPPRDAPKTIQEEVQSENESEESYVEISSPSKYPQVDIECLMSDFQLMREKSQNLIKSELAQ